MSGRRPSTEGRAHNRQSTPRPPIRLSLACFIARSSVIEEMSQMPKAARWRIESESLLQNKELVISKVTAPSDLRYTGN